MSEMELSRRALLKAAGVLGASAALGPTALAAPARAQGGSAMVTGQIRDETTGTGIPGVAVSDGDSIAVTGVDGRYELAVDPARRRTGMVFVTVPAGWSAPPGAGMVPDFFRRVALAPGEPARADFALRPDPYGRDTDYRFLAIADPHVRPSGGFPFDPDPVARWRGQIDQFNRLVTAAGDRPDGRVRAPRFLAVAGDLTQIGFPEEFEAFRQGTAESLVPVWPVFGNHDYPLAGLGITPDPDYDEAVDGYRRAVGPEWYSFDYGNQHFVALENMVGIGQLDQLRWLAADLALHGPDREVVVMFHAPFPEADWWLERYYPDHEDSVARAYLDVLAPYDVQLMLSGHAHVNRVDRDFPPGGLHVNTNSSYYSLDQTPLGFRLLDIRAGQQVKAPFKMYGVPFVLTLVHPGPAARVPEGSLTAQISAYNTTSDVVEARFKVDGGPWRPMTPSGDWTWSARLDTAALGAGEHRWHAQARDDNGRRWSQMSTFTVVPAGQLTPPVPGTDWPSFHGTAARGGHTPDAVTPPLRLAWSHRTGGTILTGSPVVSGNTVYIGVRDEHDVHVCGLVAVDLATGEQRWRVDADSLVEATPTVADGRVYSTSVGGTLQALDAATGAVLWTHQADGGDPLTYPKAYSSLAVADGLVISAYQITGGASVVQARAAGTGELVWTYTGNLSVSTSRKPVAVGGGRVYLNPGNTFFPVLPPIGLDLATGEHVWSGRRVPDGEDGAVVGGQGPVVYADGTLLTTYVDRQSQGPNAVFAFDTGSGDNPNELWRYLGPRRVLAEANLDGTAPAVAAGAAFASLPSGVVVALDLATGEVRWLRDLGAALLSSPAVAGSTLYVGGNDGRLHALDIDDGDVRWSYQIGSWVASSPAVTGNSVLVGAWDGNLYAFTADAG